MRGLLRCKGVGVIDAYVAGSGFVARVQLHCHRKTLLSHRFAAMVHPEYARSMYVQQFCAAWPRDGMRSAVGRTGRQLRFP